jgi:hypothetical protein
LEGQRAPSATPEQLAAQGNPLALAAAAGFKIEDFTRQGGPGPAQVTAPQQPGFDASGRLFSDTAALLDRTFSSLSAQIDDMRKQLSDLLNQVLARLADEVLIPLIKAAVQSALSSLSNAVTDKIGTSLGQSAGPPIADAVGKSFASAQASGSAGGSSVPILGDLFGGVLDEGGEWPSGTVGLNLSGSTERVLSPAQTSLFDSGLLGGWNLGQFAYRPGSGNATAAADVLGLGQVPIIGGLVNLIGEVLFSVIGIEIQVRNTLLKLADDFRGFRGDAFAAFAAQGQLLDDTSTLIDRTLSSLDVVADERARILTQIITGTLTYVLNNVVIPIGKAAASATVSALASAAGTATSLGIAAGGGGTSGGIAGAFVSSLITGIGDAAIEIVSKVIQDAGDALIKVGTKAIFDFARQNFPGLSRTLLAGFAQRTRPVPFPDLTGQPLGSLPLFVNTNFDNGGVAYGTGLMPKATIPPERVLSTRQTVAFERFVDALTSGDTAVGSSTTVINAPMHVVAGPDQPEQIHDRLLALLS